MEKKKYKGGYLWGREFIEGVRGACYNERKG